MSFLVANVPRYGCIAWSSAPPESLKTVQPTNLEHAESLWENISQVLSLATQGDVLFLSAVSMPTIQRYRQQLPSMHFIFLTRAPHHQCLLLFIIMFFSSPTNISVHRHRRGTNRIAAENRLGNWTYGVQNKGTESKRGNPSNFYAMIRLFVL